jgi:hypothetical protein
MALVLGVSLVGCTGPVTPTAPDTIMIGSPRDLDEDQFIFQCYHGGPAMRWFVNKTNTEDGGIYLSYYNATVPLELVVRDFNLASWDIGTVCQGLIDDGANVIFGGPSTDSIYTLAPICNAASVILLTFEGGASKMVWDHQDYIDNWPYVWINLSFANWYEIPVLKAIMDRTATPGDRDPIAYVTYIGGLGAEHGLEYAQATINEFDGGNVSVGNVLPLGGALGAGLEHPFIMTQPEANTIIQNAKTALNVSGHGPDYDIFCAYTYPWNVAALFAAAQTFDFNPPAMVFGPGSSQGYFTVQFGNNSVEGIMSFGTSNAKTIVNVGTPDISMAELYDELGAQIEDDWVHYTDVCPNIFGAAHGTDVLDFWGQAIFEAGMEMWKTAVVQVGKLDNTAIRNKMAAFSSSNPCSTCFGDTWYQVFGFDPITHQPNKAGGGIVDYMCQTGQIGQWQNGTFEIIGFTGINSTNWAVPPAYWASQPYGSLNATPLPNYDVTAPYEAMLDNWYWLSH